MSNVSTNSPLSTPTKHPRTPWKEAKHQYGSPFSTPSKSRGLRQALTPRTPPKAPFLALPFAESPLKQPPWRYPVAMTFKESDPSESRRAALMLSEEEGVVIVKKMADTIPLTPAAQLWRAEQDRDDKEPRKHSGQSGDDEEDRIVDPFPLSIFDSLIKQNLRILKYINSVDHFYSLFVPFYDQRMNTEWAEPSHELNMAVNGADYPGEEKYNFWEEVKRRKFYNSFAPSSPYRYQSPLARSPPYTPTKSEDLKAEITVNNLSSPLDRSFRSPPHSISSSSNSVTSTPSSRASRSPASSVPNTPSKDREKGELQGQKERDRELLRIKLAQILHTAKVSSLQTRHISPTDHTNSTEHEAETFITLLQSDDTLLDLLQQLRKQSMKKERKREPRREVGKILKDFLMQFNHCLLDKLSFLSQNHHNSSSNRTPSTPLKHHQHYKKSWRSSHLPKKKKDPLNFPLPEDPICGTPKHPRRKPAAPPSSLPKSSSPTVRNIEQSSETPHQIILGTQAGPTDLGESRSDPGSDSEAPENGEVELSTFLVTSALLNSPSKKDPEDDDMIPPSPSSSLSSPKGLWKKFRFSNPLNALSSSPTYTEKTHPDSKNDFSSRLSAIINPSHPVEIKLSPSFLNRKPRRARGSQSRASSRYLASGRAPPGINSVSGLDSPSTRCMIDNLRPYSSHSDLQQALDLRPSSSSPYSLPLTPSSSKNSHLDISSSPPSSPFSPIAHLSSSITSGLSYFTRRSLLPAFDSSSSPTITSEPMPSASSNSDSTMVESSFANMLSETLEPLDEIDEASEFLGSSTGVSHCILLDSSTTSGGSSTSISSTTSSHSRGNRRKSVSSTPSKHSSRSSNSSVGSRSGRRRRRRPKPQERLQVPPEVQSDVLDLLEFLCTPEELAAQNRDPLEEQEQDQSGRPPRSFSYLPREDRMTRKKVSEEELIRLRAALGQLKNLGLGGNPDSSLPGGEDQGFKEVQMDGRDIVHPVGGHINAITDDQDEVYVTEEGHTLVRGSSLGLSASGSDVGLSRPHSKRPAGLRFELRSPVPLLQGNDAIGLLV